MVYICARCGGIIREVDDGDDRESTGLHHLCGIRMALEKMKVLALIVVGALVVAACVGSLLRLVFGAM